MYHRLNITEKTFWKHYNELRGHGCKPATKLEAWSTLIHSTATYGSGWWRHDLETLREAHKWELHHFRKAFPTTHEANRHGYNQKTARFQEQLHQQLKQPLLIHKYLDKVYRNAHRHLHHKDNLNRNPTQELRDHRNRKWWKAMLSWTWYKRSKEGATQRRQGNWPEHEDTPERIHGDTWQTNARQMNKKNWVHERRTKSQAYLKAHKLPIHPNLATKTNDNSNNNYNNRYNNTKERQQPITNRGGRPGRHQRNMGRTPQRLQDHSRQQATMRQHQRRRHTRLRQQPRLRDMQHHHK